MNTKSLLTKIAVPVLGLGLLGGTAVTLAGPASAATTGVTGSVTCGSTDPVGESGGGQLMTGTINHNVDVPAGTYCSMQSAHVLGNVSVEGVLRATATTIDRNVGVSGPGSAFKTFNDPGVTIHGNLSVINSTGEPSDGMSLGTWATTTQVDGNLSVTGTSGWVLTNNPMHVSGSANFSGNNFPNANWFNISQLTADGGIHIS